MKLTALSDSRSIGYYKCTWAGGVALCYDCFSEKPKLGNVELG